MADINKLILNGVAPDKLYIGGTEAEKVYLGTELVYEVAAAVVGCILYFDGSSHGDNGKTLYASGTKDWFIEYDIEITGDTGTSQLNGFYYASGSSTGYLFGRSSDGGYYFYVNGVTRTYNVGDWVIGGRHKLKYLWRSSDKHTLLYVDDVLIEDIATTVTPQALGQFVVGGRLNKYNGLNSVDNRIKGYIHFAEVNQTNGDRYRYNMDSERIDYEPSAVGYSTANLILTNVEAKDWECE